MGIDNNKILVCVQIDEFNNKSDRVQGTVRWFVTSLFDLGCAIGQDKKQNPAFTISWIRVAVIGSEKIKVSPSFYQDQIFLFIKLTCITGHICFIIAHEIQFNIHFNTENKYIKSNNDVWYTICVITYFNLPFHFSVYSWWRRKYQIKIYVFKKKKNRKNKQINK